MDYQVDDCSDVQSELTNKFNHRSLNDNYENKKATWKKLCVEKDKIEAKLFDNHQNYDSVCTQNHFLNGRSRTLVYTRVYSRNKSELQMRKKLCCQEEKEKNELENSITDLRQEIMKIRSAIKDEKESQNSNLIYYEDQIAAFSSFFLEKCDSFKENELELAIKKICSSKESLDKEFKFIQNNFHKIQMRKENIENAYLQIHSSYLKDFKKLINEYSEETSNLTWKNLQLADKVENLEQCLKSTNIDF